MIIQTVSQLHVFHFGHLKRRVCPAARIVSHCGFAILQPFWEEIRRTRHIGNLAAALQSVARTSPDTGCGRLADDAAASM